MNNDVQQAANEVADIINRYAKTANCASDFDDWFKDFIKNIEFSMDGEGEFSGYDLKFDWDETGKGQVFIISGKFDEFPSGVIAVSDGVKAEAELSQLSLYLIWEFVEQWFIRASKR